MHKGFKCLDVGEGCLYISRDVVFDDDDVYPYAQLHPNAGAHLRSKILLLPSTLLNPSSRDDNSSDPFDNGSLLTNCLDEHAGSGENSRENSASNDPTPAANGVILCTRGTFLFLAGIGVGSNVDPLATSTSSLLGSSLDQPPTASAPVAPMSTPRSTSPHMPPGLAPCHRVPRTWG